jgi:hypothetical protein
MGDGSVSSSCTLIFHGGSGYYARAGHISAAMFARTWLKFSVRFDSER